MPHDWALQIESPGLRLEQLDRLNKGSGWAEEGREGVRSAAQEAKRVYKSLRSVTNVTGLSQTTDACHVRRFGDPPYRRSLRIADVTNESNQPLISP